ncbi:unnamed protein product, partial [Acidithrix sp. C25]
VVAESRARPFGTGGSCDDGLTHHRKREHKTASNTGGAQRGKNDPRASENEARGMNLEKGASSE